MRQIENDLLQIWTLLGSTDRVLRSELLDEWRRLLAEHSKQLIAKNNPQGFLISLDLEPIPDAERQRRDLIAQWLGGEVANHSHFVVRNGLVSLQVGPGDTGVLKQLMAGPGQHYLEHVSLFGTANEIDAHLKLIAGGVHAWLQGIDLLGVDRDKAINSETIAKIIDATPAMRQLQISGSGLIEEVPHPGLQRLTIDGYLAIGALTGGRGAGFPNVTHLDFAFQSTFPRDPTPEELVGLLACSQLPALRRLRLSRNEPGYGAGLRHQGGRVSVFRFLRTRDIKQQLMELELPSIRVLDDAKNLQDALSDMPCLIDLSVSNNYVGSAQFRHPSARLGIPVAWPWPPRDELETTARIIVELPDGVAISVVLVDGISVLERVFKDLTDVARAAWTRFWTIVRHVIASRSAASILAGVAVTAVSSCSAAFADDSWRSLSRAIGKRRFSADMVFHIRPET